MVSVMQILQAQQLTQRQSITEIDWYHWDLQDPSKCQQI